MKLAITYAELQDYVASHFHKTVNFGYVDGATVSVSVPIKVLGFTATETGMYVFKENLALCGMGTVLGLLMGKLLLAFVIDQIRIDFVWFRAKLLLPSYIWSVILTILTALLVDLFFYFRLEKINMAEALKSVE